MGYLTECREFFGQFRQRFATTGSVMPSSRALARAMTRPLTRAGGPRRILEVGPGTGAVTCEIVRALRPGDQLDIVEINEKFVAIIERRFAEEEEFRRCREWTRVIHAPLQEVPGERVYDFMVSGLPHNIFPLSLVEEIFGCYARLLKPEGTLSYFEYPWMMEIKKPFMKRDDGTRLTALKAWLKEQIGKHQVAEELVLRNVPPAVARHMNFGTKQTAQAPG